MRYIKTYKLFENNNEDITLYDLMNGILENKYEASKIKEAFDLDKAILDLDDDDFYSYKLVVEIDENDIIDAMGLEECIFGFFDSIRSNYSSFEYNYDDEEYDYIHNEISDKNIDKFRNLCRWLGYGELKDKYESKKDDNTGLVYEPCKEYGLTDFLLREMKWHKEAIAEEAIRKKLKAEIDDVTPIEILYNHSYGYRKPRKECELIFDYSVVTKFLEDYKIKDKVYTLSQFLESVGNKLPYSYDLQYEFYGYENNEEYKKLDSIFEDNLDNLWDDELKLPEQELIYLLIKNDNIDVIKEHFDEIDWNDKYKLYGEYKYLVEYAKKDSKCYNWFISDEFNKKIQDFDQKFIDIVDEMIVKEESEELGLL